MTGLPRRTRKEGRGQGQGQVAERQMGGLGGISNVQAPFYLLKRILGLVEKLED